MRWQCLSHVLIGEKEFIREITVETAGGCIEKEHLKGRGVIWEPVSGIWTSFNHRTNPYWFLCTRGCTWHGRCIIKQTPSTFKMMMLFNSCVLQFPHLWNTLYASELQGGVTRITWASFFVVFLFFCTWASIGYIMPRQSGSHWHIGNAH